MNDEDQCYIVLTIVIDDDLYQSFYITLINNKWEVLVAVVRGD